MIKKISDERNWNVRIVHQGEHYGLNDMLTHDSSDPLLEFYDATYEGPKFGPLGQFVSRYYVSTIMGIQENSYGLCLDGGIPEWQVNGQSIATIQDWISSSDWWNVAPSDIPESLKDSWPTMNREERK